MVGLKEYKEYFTIIMEAAYFDHIKFVVQEEHLKKRLKDLTGVVFAVVYPDASGTGSADNVSDLNSCLLFILENLNKTDTDDEEEFNAYARLQGMASRLKVRIIKDSADYRFFLTELDIESFSIEPVWNIAGSYIGYSISFDFKK